MFEIDEDINALAWLVLGIALPILFFGLGFVLGRLTA